jgi:hypothetical protein
VGFDSADHSIPRYNFSGQSKGATSLYPVSQPEWVQFARQFIALDDQQALQKAASARGDPEIIAVLENPGAWQPIAAMFAKSLGPHVRRLPLVPSVPPRPRFVMPIT